MTATRAAVPTPFERTPHLVALIAEAERLATRIAEARRHDAEVLRQLAADSAVASLRLDGSPVDGPPDDAALRRAADAIADAPPRAPRDDAGQAASTSSPGWLHLMRPATDGPVEVPDELVGALEYLGVRAALASDDLTGALLHEPRAALTELHRRLTRGLVDPSDAGRPRRTRQAVHDASVGRVIYFAPDPTDVPTRLSLLCGWLDSAAAREHGVIASGLVHLELLRLHPFAAANGRLARAAARLVLRARGLDPGGTAAVEVRLADDPVGVAEEVARTEHRADATIWLERWGEAVTGGLRLAADRLALLDPTVPDRARRFLEGCGRRFTVADYRAEAGVGREDARADLTALLEAGRITRVPGARGLRFVTERSRAGPTGAASAGRE